MIKTWYIIILTFIFYSLCGQNEADLRKLRVKINMYDDAGAHALVIERAKHLYETASALPLDSLSLEYRCVALMFLMDRYKLSNPKLFAQTFDAFMAEFNQPVSKSDNIQFAYFIFKHDLHAINTDQDELLKTLSVAERFVIEHSAELDRQVSVFWKMLIHRRRGDYYLKESNFSLCKMQYEFALSESRAVDSLNKAKQGKFFNYERMQLINLFKLAVLSNDNVTMKRIYNLLQRNTKKSLYENNWNREFIQALLYGTEIPIKQIQTILPQLVNNELLRKDPLNYIKISQYFLDSNYIVEAEFYKERARLLLPDFLNSFNIPIQYNLLDAGFALQAGQVEKMDSLIMSSLQWLQGPQHKLNTTPIIGSRRDYLAFMQRAIVMYTKAYERTGENSLLVQCAALTDAAIYPLYYLRLDLPDETDRTLLLSQLTDLCDKALLNYAELFKNKTPTRQQASILINYMEANKSFNLLLNRQIKDHAPESMVSILNSLDGATNLMAQQFSLHADQSDAMILQRSELIDSSVKIWEWALANSKMKDLLTIDQVQGKLKSNQSLIEFFTSSNHIFSLLINKDEVSFQRLFIPKDTSIASINELIFKMGNLIEDGSSGQDLQLEDYKRTAHQIYNILIAPVADQLKEKIIIIPEANMSTVPWGALLEEFPSQMDCRNWPYWIKSHTIATQHSLALWLMENYRKDFKNHQAPFSAYAPYFENLQFNIEECRKLQALNQGSVFSNEQANLQNFFDHAPHSRIIHISSHAKASVNYDDSSYIVFHTDTLYSGEIEQLNFSAELVFLSACETGIGKVIQAEGVMSFARSFFNGGAHAVISTLWEVNDQKSFNQVIKIYEYLLKGQSKDQAIQSMQLDYLRDARNPNAAYPYFWASYQCQGELNPIFSIFHPYRTALKLIIILTMSLSSGILFYRIKFSKKRDQVAAA